MKRRLAQQFFDTLNQQGGAVRLPAFYHDIKKTLIVGQGTPAFVAVGSVNLARQ